MMKLSHFLMTCFAVALVATSCEERQILPGDNSFNQDSIYVAPPAAFPDSVLPYIPEDAITVPEARAICAGLASGDVTSETYYVKGWICNVDASKTEEAITKGYYNAFFHMGVSPMSETKDALYAFQVLGLNGKKIYVPEAVQVGDVVVIKCHLTNFSGTYETKGQGDAHIYYTTNPLISARPAATEVTCAEAKEIALALSSNNTPTSEYYCVTGYITSIVGSVSRGQQTFWMDDTAGSTKTFEGYYTNLPDGVTEFTVGQRVKLYGNIMKYNTTPEIKNGDVEFITE